MRRLTVLSVVVLVASLSFSQDDYSKLAFNIGGGVGIPLRDTSDVANVSGNFVAGGGFNANRHLGFTGEFMWHGLPPTDRVKAAVLAPDASANLYSVTANVIFGGIGRRGIGVYAIGGGGWYHRNWEITAPVVVPGTVCSPFYSWYGVTCVNGLVPADLVLRDGSADGGGLNVGAGITFGRREKIYAEVRYHHAFMSDFDTDVLPVTFGFRW